MDEQRSEVDESYLKLYIFLPLIKSAFERDRNIIRRLFKTPEPYVRLLNIAIRNVEYDLNEVNRKLNVLRIKILEEARTDRGVVVGYLCGEHQRSLTISTAAIIAQSSIHMEKYLGLDIFKYISTEDVESSNGYLVNSIGGIVSGI